MTRQKFANWLSYAIVFLLPWQTVRIVQEFTLDGEPWEYGKLMIYAVELLLILLALVRWNHRPLSGSSKPIGYGLFLIAGAFFSLGFAESVVLGLAHIFHLVSALALFYMLLDEKLKSEHLAMAFVLGLAIPSVLGWAQVISGKSPAFTWLGLAAHDAAILGQSVVETEGGRILRAYGSLPHPNIFGGFLAVAVLMIAWLLHRHRMHKHHWSALLPLVLTACTLVVTFSRGAWLGVTAGMLVVIGLMFWFKKIPPRSAFPIATVGFLAVLVTMFVFHTALFTRITPSARLEAKSIETRAGEYQQFWEVAQQNPVTGVGAGNYTLALGKTYPGQPVWAYQPMHNTLLLIFTEIGLVGFLLFVRWFTSIDQINWKVRKTANGIFAMAVGTVVLVLALLDHYPWSTWPGLALMGFSFAMMLRWSLEARPS